LLAEVTPVVRVRYPWDPVADDNSEPTVRTGIPPHVAILQELSTMGEPSNKFIAEFSSMVNTILDEASH
jgi:hypothetical protein